MDILGPRILQYRHASGRQGEIRITLTRQPDVAVDIGDDEPLVEPAFAVGVTCDWFSWSKTFSAADDLQSIFRCMWLSDIYVQKICRDNGFQLFSLTPGDISDDLDTFKK